MKTNKIFNFRLIVSFFTLLFLTILCILTLGSCSSDDSGDGYKVSLSSKDGADGDLVTVYGPGFTEGMGGVRVYFGELEGAITGTRTGEIEVMVPVRGDNAIVDVYVNNGGRISGTVPFRYRQYEPAISSLSSGRGISGTELQISGTEFGSNEALVTTYVGGKAAEIISFSSTDITIELPEGGGLRDTEIYIVVSSTESNRMPFMYTDHLPRLSSFGEYAGLHGETLVINGASFNTSQGGMQVWFDETPANVLSATGQEIKVEVPYIYRDEAHVSVLNEEYPDEPSNSLIYRYDLNACDSTAVTGAAWTVDTSKGSGVELRYGRMRAFNSTQTINYVMVPIGGDIEIGVEYERNNLTQTTTMCERMGAFAGINGSYFTWDPVGAWDYFRWQGTEVIPANIARSSPVYVNGGFILNGTEDISIVKMPLGSANGPELAGETIITAGPVLVYGSALQTIASHSHNDERHPRSGVGVTKDNHLLMVVVDGRNSGIADGMTNTEFAKLMRYLGATDAINFDGGGSSTLYYEGFGNNHIVNNPSDGSEREGANVVYARFK